MVLHERLPKLPPNLAPLINLVKLTLPHDDNLNLPEHAESTIDVPHHKVHYLKKAFDGLQQEMARFLETSAPDWVVYDFVPHWLPPIAAKLGIPRAFFSIFNAWTICFFGSSPAMMMEGSNPRTEPEHFTVPPNWVPFPSNVAFRLHEIKKMLDGVKENVSGVSDGFRFGSAPSGCDVFAIRSCMELEPDWLKLLGELYRKPIVPVGLMPPSVQDYVNDQDDTWLSISGWLDKQHKGSVVYVALGTEATPSQEELTEMALGLELSELPFFWVIRKRSGSVEHDCFELPDGFEERIKGRGVVWTSWAPQLKILAHDSVGSFLAHCGWSSIIEGLQFGHPLVLLPFLGDQGLNARVLEEKKVGIEIVRDERDGSFTRNSVAESLRLVMVENEGKTCKDKAKEMMAIFGDEDRHDRYIDNFIEYLRNHR